MFGDRAFVITNCPNMNSFSVHNLHKGSGGKFIPCSPAEYETIKLHLCSGIDVLILYSGIYLALQRLTHQDDEAIALK